MSEFNETSLFFDDDFEFDGVMEDLEEGEKEEKYTTKVAIPEYVPSKYCPAISDMMNTEKYEELIMAINSSSQPDDVKRFLRLAASRHIIFNYSKIADYYAHADKELQGLMEDSALVIVDINKALVNGFARLDYRLMEIAEKSRELQQEVEE